MACQVGQKGAGKGYAVSMVLAVLAYLGLATVMLQTDPETAIVQVVREVQKTRPADTSMTRQTPKGQSRLERPH